MKKSALQSDKLSVSATLLISIGLAGIMYGSLLIAYSKKPVVLPIEYLISPK